MELLSKIVFVNYKAVRANTKGAELFLIILFLQNIGGPLSRRICEYTEST